MNSNTHGYHDAYDGADDDLGDSPDLDSDTIACLNCHRQIHEDASQCPYCGEWVTTEGPSSPRKPIWIIIATLLCLYAIFRWIIP